MNDSKIDQLKDLQELLNTNVISQAEFTEMKKNILEGTGSEIKTVVSKKSHKVRNVILSIIVFLFVIGGIGTAYVVKNNNDKKILNKNKSKTHKKTKSTVSKKKEKNSSSTSEEASEKTVESKQSNSEIVSKTIIGQGYSIAPILFNGENVDQAMTNNDAPQNLVHDGHSEVYFVDGGSALLKTGMGMSQPALSITYSIDENNISINLPSHTILTVPYTVNGGNVQLDHWTSDMNGDSVTWSMEPDANAKNDINN